LPPEIEKERLSAAAMKSSDAHETEEDETKPALEFSKGLKVEVKDLPTDTW
jgi:hypothetical protein